MCFLIVSTIKIQAKNKSRRSDKRSDGELEEGQESFLSSASLSWA
jgi:hypothetical protein